MGTGAGSGQGTGRGVYGEWSTESVCGDRPAAPLPSVAYASDVSGIEEVYLLPFPGPGHRHTVSVGGGTDPRWSSDGTELFYRSGTRIWAVDLRTSPTVAVGSPHMLFVAGQYDFSQTLNWDVGPDGRFVMVKGDPSALRQFQVVLNWFQELAAEGTGGAP